MGLPALAVGWGAIDDVGYLAREEELKEKIESWSGLRSVASRKALDTLEQLILAGAVNVAAVDFNWPKTLKNLPSGDALKFVYVSGQESDDSADAGQIEGLRDLLVELQPDERLEMLTQLIAEQVAKILRISASKLDVNRSLLEMGIDSLMGVEMQMSIEKQFGVEIPTMELMGGISIAQIAGRIHDGIMADAPAVPATEADDDDDVVSRLTAQVDDVSDEALDAYLQDLGHDATEIEDHVQ